MADPEVDVAGSEQSRRITVRRLEPGESLTDWRGEPVRLRRPWVGLVAERGGAAVGFCHYRRFGDIMRLDGEISERVRGPFVLPDRGGRVIYLDSVWVEPPERGRGVMRALLAPVAAERLPLYAGFREWTLASWFAVELAREGTDRAAARAHREAVLVGEERLRDDLEGAIAAVRRAAGVDPQGPRAGAAEVAEASGLLVRCFERLGGRPGGMRLVLRTSPLVLLAFIADDGWVLAPADLRLGESDDPEDEPAERARSAANRRLELAEGLIGIGLVDLSRHSGWFRRDPLGNEHLFVSPEEAPRVVGPV